MRLSGAVIKRTARGVRVVLLAAVLGLFLAPIDAAHAGALADAKATGLVGERMDGYLGVVDPAAPADVRAMVTDINAKRRAKYQAVAGAQSISLKAVEAIAGKKLIERARPGEYVMDASGQWRRK